MKGPTVTNIDEGFVNLIKSRLLELREELRFEVRDNRKSDLQMAIANNCSWLVMMGQSIDIPQVKYKG